MPTHFFTDWWMLFEFQLKRVDYKAAALSARNEVLDSVGELDLINYSNIYSR
jgi:hypothetical protein